MLSKANAGYNNANSYKLMQPLVLGVDKLNSILSIVAEQDEDSYLETARVNLPKIILI